MIEQVAAGQHGLITRRQAQECGVGRGRIARLLKSGAWQRKGRGVFAIAAGGWEQRVLAACLATRGVASQQTAARLHRLDGFDKVEQVQVAIPGESRRKHLGKRAYRTELAGLSQLDHIPCTDIEQTLIDLAAVVPVDLLAIAVESAWRDDPHVLFTLRVRLHQQGRQGRPGLAKLREVLDDCARRPCALDSVFEVLMWRVFKREGLPLPECKVSFFDDRGELRPDFVLPAYGIVIECDSFEHHRKTEAQLRKDVRRDRRYAALGHRLIKVLYSDVTKVEDCQELVKDLRSAIAAVPRRRLRPEFHDDPPIPHAVLMRSGAGRLVA